MSLIIKSVGTGSFSLAVAVTIRDTETGGEQTMNVLRSFWEESGLSVGDTVNDETDEVLSHAARVFECAADGIRLLGYSDNSVRGIAKKLRTRGYDRDTAEEAAIALSDAGYINEAAQIERRGTALAERKLRGRRRIAADLSALGYDRDAISEWIRDADIDFGAICARAIEKHGGMPPRDDTNGRRKLMSYLYRQGFSGDDIRAAVRILADMNKDE